MNMRRILYDYGNSLLLTLYQCNVTDVNTWKTVQSVKVDRQRLIVIIIIYKYGLIG